MLAAVLVAVLFHLPSLDTGYVSDDSLLSLIPGDMEIQGDSLLDRVADFVPYFAERGRFYPVAATALANYVFFPTLLSYKLSKLAALLVVFALFGGFVRRLTGCRATALLSVVLCGVLHQYRLYHDGVLTFGWQLPQAVGFFLGGLHLQLIADERDSRRHRIGSAVLFALSMMSYEIMQPLVLVHLALAPWNRGLRAVRKSVLPHVVLASLFALVLLSLRAYYEPPPTSATQTNVDVIEMLGLAVQQAFAAIPLSYGLTEGTLFSPEMLPVTLGVLLLVPALLMVAHRVRAISLGTRASSSDALNIRRTVWVGLLIWVLPAVAIMPSSKYQREVVWGIGYIPVFVAVFGVALLIAAGLVAGLRRIRNPSAQFLMLAATVVPLTVLGYQHNNAVAQVLATQWRHPRTVLREALEAQLIDPDVASVGVWVQSGARNCRWEAPGFFMMHLGVALDVHAPVPPPDRLRPPVGFVALGVAQPLEKPLTYIAYGAPSEDTGLAVGGMIDAVIPGENPRALARQLQVYVRRPMHDPAEANFGYFHPFPHGASAHFEEVDDAGRTKRRAMWIEREVHGPGLSLARSGDHWELWHLEATPGHYLLPSTFRISTLPN